jgi:hypothetical protein
VGVAALVEIAVGIAHCLRLAAAEHDLEPYRLEAFILKAVNDAGRTGDAFPRAELSADAVILLCG